MLYYVKHSKQSMHDKSFIIKIPFFKRIIISKITVLQKNKNKSKTFEDKLSGKKDFRGLASTTNHRFIALLLRWGKKSKSYNVLLNTFNQCKQLVDLSSQSEGKGAGSVYSDYSEYSEYSALQSKQSTQSTPSKQSTQITLSTGIVNHNKNNKTQNFPIKSSIKKRATDLVLPSDKVAMEENILNVPSLANHFAVYRGAWNRFRKNLLVFYCNSNKNSTSFISHEGQEVKVPFTESLSYNLADSCTYAHLLACSAYSVKQLLSKAEHTQSTQSNTSEAEYDSQLKKYSPLTPNKHGFFGHFCVNKRLISRRVGFKVPLEFLKPSTTIKESQVGMITSEKGLHTKSQVDSKNNAKPDSKNTSKKDLKNIPKRENLIELAQGGKKQDSNKIPKSVLLKKKDTKVKVFRGVCAIERTTIGSNSVSRVSPTLETRKVRIGGATYAVPYVPHNRRQEGVGIRWLLASASAKRQKSKYRLEYCLANELLDSLKNHGESMKKRDQSHQVAASNRAYTRYRWW